MPRLLAAGCAAAVSLLLGRYADAIKFYDKALEIDPKFLCAWVNKGMALSRLGRYQEAISAFDQAIEINPKLETTRKRKENAIKKIREMT